MFVELVKRWDMLIKQCQGTALSKQMTNDTLIRGWFTVSQFHIHCGNIETTLFEGVLQVISRGISDLVDQSGGRTNINTHIGDYITPLNTLDLLRRRFCTLTERELTLGSDVCRLQIMTIPAQ